MPEITIDLPSLSRAVEHVRATGEASLLGEAIAQGFGERLEEILRSLARDAAQARPSRDQLAAMAMQGALASYAGSNTDPDPAVIARYAHDIADAMLAERERRAAATPTAEVTP